MAVSTLLQAIANQDANFLSCQRIAEAYRNMLVTCSLVGEAQDHAATSRLV